MNEAHTQETMEDITNIWEFCPDELLICIFKFADPKTLLNCMFVNTKWKDAAEYVAECLNVWPEILRIANLYVSVNNKTTLSFKDLFANSILWDKVQIAESTHINTYQMQKIEKIRIFIDHLIVCTGEEVQYYDIKTFRLIRILPIHCIDYQENYIMVLKVFENKSVLKSVDLELSGKLFDDQGRQRTVTIPYVTHYLLQNHNCYIINEFHLIGLCSWTNNTWVKTLVSRFAMEGVTTLHVNNGQLYIATKSGNILTPESRTFRRTQWFKLPEDTHLFGMFNKTDVIVSVNEPVQSTLSTALHGLRSFISHASSSKARSKPHVDYDADLDQAVIGTKGLSCVLEHGPVLFLGMKNGMVFAYLIRKLRDLSGPERCFHVAELDSKIKDREITNIEVHEAALSHHLFISTRTQIFQILLTYPENYDYWDFSSLHRIDESSENSGPYAQKVNSQTSWILYRVLKTATTWED